MQLVWSGFWSCFVIIVLVMFIIVLSKKDLFSYFTWKLLHRLGTISNGWCTLYYGLIESSWISSLICLSFHFHLNKIIDLFFQSHLLLSLKKKNPIFFWLISTLHLSFDYELHHSQSLHFGNIIFTMVSYNNNKMVVSNPASDYFGGNQVLWNVVWEYQSKKMMKLQC